MSVSPTQEPEGSQPPANPVAAAAGSGMDETILSSSPSPPKRDWRGLFRMAWRGVNNVLDDIVVVMGSDNVYLASRELPEPASYAAFVARSKVNGKVIAMGDKARAMVGREPQNIEVIRLLTHGIPDNPAMFGDFLQAVVKKHFKHLPFLRPRVLVSGNFHTPLMKQVCTEGLLRIRTRDVMFCEPEVAAAVGLGLDILKPDLQTVMVFEKDWLGFMVISMSGSLTRLRMQLGFHDLLEDILIFFEEAGDFAPRVDDLEEQFLTQGLGTGAKLVGWETWAGEVERGRRMEVTAGPEQFQRAVTPSLLRIKRGVNRSLESLSPEQRYTVQTSPTYLAGEYADLPGFREALERLFGRKFLISERPHHAMATGLVNLVPEIEMLKAINGRSEGGVDL